MHDASHRLENARIPPNSPLHAHTSFAPGVRLPRLWRTSLCFRTSPCALAIHRLTHFWHARFRGR
eukprot:scaffold986_cov237-Pinguiococcus_pyrenoidosus.AAC.29